MQPLKFMRLPTLVRLSKLMMSFIIIEGHQLSLLLILAQRSHGLILFSMVILFGVLVMPVSTNTIQLTSNMILPWPVLSTTINTFGPLLKALLFWVGLLLEQPTSTITHWEHSTFQHLAQLHWLVQFQDSIMNLLPPIHQLSLYQKLSVRLLFMENYQQILQNSLPKAFQYHLQQRQYNNS